MAAKIVFYNKKQILFSKKILNGDTDVRERLTGRIKKKMIETSEYYIE